MILENQEQADKELKKTKREESKKKRKKINKLESERIPTLSISQKYEKNERIYVEELSTEPKLNFSSNPKFGDMSTFDQTASVSNNNALSLRPSSFKPKKNSSMNVSLTKLQLGETRQDLEPITEEDKEPQSKS